MWDMEERRGLTVREGVEGGYVTMRPRSDLGELGLEDGGHVGETVRGGESGAGGGRDRRRARLPWRGKRRKRDEYTC